MKFKLSTKKLNTKWVKEKLHSFIKQEKQNNLQSNGKNTAYIGTPFTVRERSNDVIITLGDNIVGIYKSKKDAYKAIYEKDWNLIFTANIAMQAGIEASKNKKK